MNTGNQRVSALVIIGIVLSILLFSAIVTVDSVEWEQAICETEEVR